VLACALLPLETARAFSLATVRAARARSNSTSFFFFSAEFLYETCVHVLADVFSELIFLLRSLLQPFLFADVLILLNTCQKKQH
jgi:hypothetical protein